MQGEDGQVVTHLRSLVSRIAALLPPRAVVVARPRSGDTRPEVDVSVNSSAP